MFWRFMIFGGWTKTEVSLQDIVEFLKKSVDRKQHKIKITMNSSVKPYLHAGKKALVR
jgi:hypothetical protein